MTEPILKLPLRVTPSEGCPGQSIIENADGVFIAGARLDQAEIIAARVNSWDQMREALRNAEYVFRVPSTGDENSSRNEVGALALMREALALAEKEQP